MPFIFFVISNLFRIRMTETKRSNMTKKNEVLRFDIPPEGSLGLLALGAVGITEWRKVRDAKSGERKLR